MGAKPFRDVCPLEKRCSKAPRGSEKRGPYSDLLALSCLEFIDFGDALTH